LITAGRIGDNGCWSGKAWLAKTGSSKASLALPKKFQTSPVNPRLTWNGEASFAFQSNPRHSTLYFDGQCIFSAQNDAYLPDQFFPDADKGLSRFALVQS
jgi:hypothetical protein